jgi:HTH-type transcriptional regulator, transcriptional repressor of NAD biosynthesis genes
VGTGLIIGKFMPLHRGHMALIDFALQKCHRLILLLAVRDHEPIPGQLRLNWLRETYGDNEKIDIRFTREPLPYSAGSSREVSKVWAEYLSKKFPGVEIIFSSEKYGEYLAEYMGTAHADYDRERGRFPVSGTDIRNEPLLNWEHIPHAVRPYFLKKVCVYGPESTGKTTLTAQLAAFYKTGHVPEMAREVLGDRHVVYEDIPRIAEFHAGEILTQERRSDRLLFCDTDLITTKIYSRHYFGRVPEFPLWVKEANRYDLYLFLEIDTPWVEDPQRDLGHRRREFRRIFMEELEKREIPFALIWGGWDERFLRAREAVETRWDLPRHLVDGESN